MILLRAKLQPPNFSREHHTDADTALQAQWLAHVGNGWSLFVEGTRAWRSPGSKGARARAAVRVNCRAMTHVAAAHGRPTRKAASFEAPAACYGERVERRTRVQVSPRHEVTVDDDYAALIARAPGRDFVVRTLAKRTAGDSPLMLGELVIASHATREKFPLAKLYPLHFRKTYYPGQLRGDPQGEFERQLKASALIDIPPPIGHEEGTFRSCLLPGRPFDMVSPFGSEPPESNLKHADKLSLAAAAGLWLLAEQMFDTLTSLQTGGMTHGDAQLHNFIVCPSPLEVLPIDFDMAVMRDGLGDDAWRERCAGDLEPLLKVAVFLQCALGAQPGELAALSLERIDALFSRSEPFVRAIEARSGLLA
jgi:hypothetical protein